MKSGIPPESPIFEHILGQINAKKRLQRGYSEEEEDLSESIPEL
jgi:hypothetical protein